MQDSQALRKQIRNSVYLQEEKAVRELASEQYLSNIQKKSVERTALTLIENCRKDKSRHNMLDAFLMEFGLSNQEGVALMCVAESLLRVPDNKTADRLIAEKIKSGNWVNHVGGSKSIFVNASTWGLMLTGYIVELDNEIQSSTKSWLKQFSAKLGEPIIRKAIFKAMKIMANQYVLGQTIDDAISAKTKKSLFSFDMLGEGSRTENDSINYFEAYSDAIKRIGRFSALGKSVEENDGISVKLSALHNRYEFRHESTVMKKLYQRIKKLCLEAKTFNISLSLDAEESARLDLAMQIFENLSREPELNGWDGLGFVLQSYLKRAPLVLKWLDALASETNQKFMIRLVKGAYWDTEIKRAQEKGLEEYPVYTKKVNTDACYHYCTHLLSLNQGTLYPQFATHNAYTMALIAEIFKNQNFEFQRLHGMGVALFDEMQRVYLPSLKARVYAPVGDHNDLLPYLVRRLLENGANSSFVNRFLDDKEPATKLVEDPIKKISELKEYRNSEIKLPHEIFLNSETKRLNSCGLDTQNFNDFHSIKLIHKQMKNKCFDANSIINGEICYNPRITQKSSFDNREIGSWSSASTKDIRSIAKFCNSSSQEISKKSKLQRIQSLKKMADLLETKALELSYILGVEAGRTIDDALDEVREASDFCRYYARQAEIHSREQFIEKEAIGIFLCISPWNFPLAIFTGQIAAALAMGNIVIAKPAEQTPQIAFRTVELFYASGIPKSALNLLLGDGVMASKLIGSNLNLSGIAFTGSNDTAYEIQLNILKKKDSITFIAETGGQNCMIVDSTALPEQVIDDVLASAFSSAGQRCSSLRVLYLQEEVAEKVIDMLTGALESLEIGDPLDIKTDIGPLIDDHAAKKVRSHIQKMTRSAKLISKKENRGIINKASFVQPHIFELKHISQLSKEIFGPVLHVIRYKQENIEDVINQINSTGYFLTLGVHSRIKAFGDYIFNNTHHGNYYINRDMIGATVGVNPFGGSLLSGTGPKAGGPNYLRAFSKKRLLNKHSLIQEDSYLNKPMLDEQESDNIIDRLLETLDYWSKLSPSQRLETPLSMRMPKSQKNNIEYIKSNIDLPIKLSSPTGESNHLFYASRGIILFLLSPDMNESDVVKNIFLSLVCGCAIILISDKNLSDMCSKIIKDFDVFAKGQKLVIYQDYSQIKSLIQNKNILNIMMDDRLKISSYIKEEFARRKYGILNVINPLDSSQEVNTDWLLGLVLERTKTENLVASGGNTQLFNLSDDSNVIAV